MGRTPKDKDSLDNHPTFWPREELLSYQQSSPGLLVPLGNEPLWTKSKAELIREYLRLFVLITKHGVYIDGFAGPQRLGQVDKWTAKLVVEMEPKWFNEFWLCDLSSQAIDALVSLKEDHKERQIHVLGGDFNGAVHEILAAGTISEKRATFALLDQRTFECNWSTVVALSSYKKQNKIELFYFLASGWLDRAMSAVSRPTTVEQMNKWWGRPDIETLRRIKTEERARVVAKRFEQELGYKYAFPYPIFIRPQGRRVMYHMIHATDHDEAPKLMSRAYRKIAQRARPIEQIDLEDFLRSVASGDGR